MRNLSLLFRLGLCINIIMILVNAIQSDIIRLVYNWFSSIINTMMFLFTLTHNKW